MPGTSPDYWMTADDRLTATMMDVLETRTAKARKKAKGGRPATPPRPPGGGQHGR